mmetsp:Transcript_78832/g.154146  ORF Transcript_78832/g.154146 Transcript_78832/m.154146 type:complete len:212 (-) Transcript_78832:300-935(-)
MRALEVRRAGGGGVGDHQAVHALHFKRELGHMRPRYWLHVRPHLEQQCRFQFAVWRQCFHGSGDCGDEGEHGVGVVAQAFRPRHVGARHVQNNHIHVGAQRAHPFHVVRGRVTRKRVLREIDAHHKTSSAADPVSSAPFAPGLGEPSSDCLRAVGVQAEAVDDGAVLQKPEHTRFRIARLGKRGDAPNLHVPEPHLGESRESLALLVETGG